MKEGFLYVAGRIHAIKPCPFCGGNAVGVHSGVNGLSASLVCGVCETAAGARLSIKDGGRAIDEACRYSTDCGALEDLPIGSHLAVLLAISEWNFRPGDCADADEAAEIRRKTALYQSARRQLIRSNKDAPTFPEWSGGQRASDEMETLDRTLPGGAHSGVSHGGAQ